MRWPSCHACTPVWRASQGGPSPPPAQFALRRRSLELSGLLATSDEQPPAQLQQAPLLVLDVGCGSGLSGAALQRVPSLCWVGCDISQDMLALAADALAAAGPTPRLAGRAAPPTPAAGAGCCGGLVRSDMGQGLPFFSCCGEEEEEEGGGGRFDAAVSASAVQWLLVAPDWLAASVRFFRSLYR